MDAISFERKDADMLTQQDETKMKEARTLDASSGSRRHAWILFPPDTGPDVVLDHLKFPRVSEEYFDISFLR